MAFGQVLRLFLIKQTTKTKSSTQQPLTRAEEQLEQPLTGVQKGTKFLSFTSLRAAVLARCSSSLFLRRDL